MILLKIQLLKPRFTEHFHLPACSRPSNRGPQVAGNISPHGLSVQQPAAEKTTKLQRMHTMALKSGHNIVFACGLRFHKLGLYVTCPLIFRNAAVFRGFRDVATCQTFTLNLVYDNICTWQLYALFYGCVRVKGRKGLWSLLCI